MISLDNVLPKDFDGVFRFTNFTDTDFSAKWGGIEYQFKALSTSPMVISGATPEEVQHIRKKFARELAIREWYKTPKFNAMNAHVPGGVPALYTDEDLKPFIQKCLEPLPLAQVLAKKVVTNDESKLARDEEGNAVTRVLNKGESLMKGDSAIVA